MNQTIWLIPNGINHKKIFFSLLLIRRRLIAGHNSSKITWHIGPLSIRWHYCFKLLSPDEKKNEMKHYGIALAPNLIFYSVSQRDKCLMPIASQYVFACSSHKPFYLSPSSFELIKETKKNGTQPDNNCINGLWLKDQRLHAIGKRYHGQRSVAQDIRRNSEIYRFQFWLYGLVLRFRLIVLVNA